MRLTTRLRIEQPGFVTTLQAVALASEEKLAEGQFLIANGFWSGGVYQLGYVAEMLLKSAFIRVAHPRARPGYNVGNALREAQTIGDVLIPAVDRDGYHSTRFWAMLIEATQRGQGRELTAPLLPELEQRTERIQAQWKVDMRYLPGDTLEAEAVQFEQDVLWLDAHQAELWS